MKRDKEWLKNEVEKLKTLYGDGYDEYTKDGSIYERAFRIVLELIEELDKTEPEKVVVPQFVADWIEYCRNLSNSMSYLMTYAQIKRFNHELTLWCYESGNNDNLHILARAWLDGYEVEKEPLYYVKFIDNSEATYLNQRTYERTYDGTVFLSDTSENKAYKTKFTESEIKAIDERYWPFAVPVEESQ